MGNVASARSQRPTTQRVSARELTRIALFTAMAAAAAILTRFGGSIVPFSLLPFVACLAGGALGSKAGAYSLLAYMLLGLTGLPVFASPPYGGLTYVLTPSFGFVPGFVLCAYTVGKVLEWTRRWDRGVLSLATFFISNVAGVLALYLIGIPYLGLILNIYLGKSTSLAQVLQIGFLPFIIPDLIKALVAAFISRAVTRAQRAI